MKSKKKTSTNFGVQHPKQFHWFYEPTDGDRWFAFALQHVASRQAGRHEKLTNMNEDASIKILDDFGMFWHWAWEEATKAGQLSSSRCERWMNDHGKQLQDVASTSKKEYTGLCLTKSGLAMNCTKLFDRRTEPNWKLPTMLRPHEKLPGT